MRAFYIEWNVTTASPEKTLSVLVRSGLDFSRPLRTEGGISIESSFFSKKRVSAYFKAHNILALPVLKGYLLPIYRLKDRKGLIFGTLISLFLIYLSTFYVWSVRIEGNSEISDREIVKLLSECGFGEGARKRDFDVDEVQNEALSRMKEISFLSINIHGMVADVVVHERRTVKSEKIDSVPYNLVADWDGVIVSALILNGQTLFEVGDTVLRGQLLVSGLTETVYGKTYPLHSKGKVFARTSRTLTFEVPYHVYEKRYTSFEEGSVYRILGKRIGKRSDKGRGNCDLVVTEEKVTLFGLDLPVTREITESLYYSTEKITLTPDEALDRAFDEYRRYLDNELDGIEVIEEKFSHETTEKGVKLTVELRATENIAREQKIEIQA